MGALDNAFGFRVVRAALVHSSAFWGPNRVPTPSAGRPALATTPPIDATDESTPVLHSDHSPIIGWCSLLTGFTFSRLDRNRQFPVAAMNAATGAGLVQLTTANYSLRLCGDTG